MRTKGQYACLRQDLYRSVFGEGPSGGNKDQGGPLDSYLAAGLRANPIQMQGMP